MNTQLWSKVVKEGSRKTAETPKLDPREQDFRIPCERGLNLVLRYLGPAAASGYTRIVLYLHGATFPSAPSIAHRFDGRSWRDELNAASRQVEKAIEFITDCHQQERSSVIAHSWGSIPTALCASRRPELIERIVFFAAITGEVFQAKEDTP